MQYGSITRKFRLLRPAGLYFATALLATTCLVPAAHAVTLIASQDFDALASTGTSTTDSLASGSALSNSGSFNIGGPGLGFQTFWFDTRGVTNGPVTPTGDTSDFIGVNSFTGSGAPNVAANGAAVSAGTQHNFQFNDGDGRLDLVFESVNVGGSANRQLSFNYWINDTGFEPGDSFSFTLSDGTNSQTFLNFDDTGLEGNASADNGTANWRTATANLDTLISGGFGDNLTLTISIDTNAGNENVFVDNIRFESDVVVSGPSVRTIPQIQGAGHVSPEAGNEVQTTGIVTAVQNNGFYIQDPTGDGDDATSDGIFVFTGGAPGVGIGEEVTVTGQVQEFFDKTQIAVGATGTVVATGNVGSITPTVIGSAGRTPPTEIVDDAGSTDFNPARDGRDFYESLEGMLVTLPDAVAVGTSNQFGEIYAVGEQGANATGTNARGGITIAEDNDPDNPIGADLNPERIQIDPNLANNGSVSPNVGDRLGTVTGVLDYDFSDYSIRPLAPVDVTDGGLVPETTTVPTGEDFLRVASYNVLNLDPGDGAGKFNALAGQIVNNLAAPDIIALQEIQDNDGPTNSGTTSASQTLQGLIDAINTAGGPQYAFIDNPFISDNTSGGQPGGNIRTAYLYRTDRVGFDDTDGNADGIPDSLMTVTDPSDQQTNPANPFFDTRLPLVATFTFNGEEITLINNHFSSKGGSTALFGTPQPPVNGGESERAAQAQLVNDFVVGLLAGDPNAPIVVLGDMNEFQFFDPLLLLAGTELFNLTYLLDPTDRYSFNFEGNSQQLDHILVSDALEALLASNGLFFDIVHMNSEFANAPSDHDALVAAFFLPALQMASVDEPTALALLLLGLAGAAAARRRRG